MEVVSPGGSTRGIDAVADQARRSHAAALTHHAFANVLVDLDGDQATAGANAIATFVPSADDPAHHRTVGARYYFHAVRASQGWRLSRMDIALIWDSAPTV